MRPQSSGDTPQPPCRSPRYHHPGRLTAPSFRTTLAALKSRLARSRAGRRTRRGCLTHQGVGARSGPTTSVRSVEQNVNQNSRSTSEFEAQRVTRRSRSQSVGELPKPRSPKSQPNQRCSAMSPRIRRCPGSSTRWQWTHAAGGRKFCLTDVETQWSKIRVGQIGRIPSPSRTAG